MTVLDLSAFIGLAHEIAAERTANHRASPSRTFVDQTRTAAEGDVVGAIGEVGFCVWRGLDPYKDIDRRPVPDPGWDFELPGGRVQVRGTFEQDRKLIHISKRPILWDYAVLVWCAPLPLVTVVGWCSRAEFLAGATLEEFRSSGTVNLCLHWGMLHPAWHQRAEALVLEPSACGGACPRSVRVVASPSPTHATNPHQHRTTT